MNAPKEPQTPPAPAHAPTPWKQDGSYVVMLEDPSKPILLGFRADGRTRAEDEANAALIVRAVNAFDPMRLALEKAVEYFESPPFVSLHGDTPAKQARAAIALTRQEQ